MEMIIPGWLKGERPIHPVIERWVTFRDGTYEVSNLGSIRRAKPGISTFVGRPVRPVGSPTGYMQVSLSGSRLYVHRVVTEAFLGPCPVGHVVNHKDMDKINNVLSNLEYITCKQNTAHALARIDRKRGPRKPQPPPKGLATGDRHWTHTNPEKMARGDRMPHCKLTPDAVRDIRKRAQNGEKQIALAAEYGISVAQASRVVRGIRWTYV